MTEMKEVKYTPEQLRKLREAGVLGLNPDDIIYYVPKVYRDNDFPKEKWPVFKLKPLDGKTAAEMEGKTGHVEYGKDGQGSRWVSESGPTRFKILSTHIKGWKNFLDDKGREIVFRENNGTVKPECLSQVRQGLQIELMNAINDGSDATEEELAGLEF